MGGRTDIWPSLSGPPDGTTLSVGADGSARETTAWPPRARDRFATDSSGGDRASEHQSGLFERETTEFLLSRRDTREGQRAVVVENPDGRKVLVIDEVTGKPRLGTDLTALEMPLSEALRWRFADNSDTKNPTYNSVIIDYPSGDMHIAKNPMTGQELTVSGDKPLHISSEHAQSLGLTDYMPIVSQDRLQQSLDTGPSLLRPPKSLAEVLLSLFGIATQHQADAWVGDQLTVSDRAHKVP